MSGGTEADVDAGAAHGEILTFGVGASHYAVPASEVAEVFRPPALTRVPLAPPSLLGLANLRGKVVPVLSLARILGEAAGATAETTSDASASHARVLLLRFAEPVALAVDAVGALTRQNGAKAASSSSGKRRAAAAPAVRVLALEPVIRKHFAGLFSGAPQRPRESAEPRGEVASARLGGFLSFDLAGQTYALPLEDIDEVLKVPATLSALPRREDAALGVFTLRDRLVPVIGLACLLGMPHSSTRDPGARVVIARIGASRVGLLVERVRAILRVPPETITPVPALLNRGEGEAQIQSIHRMPDGRGMVSILAAERLFRDDTIAAMLADVSEERSAMTPETQASRREQILVVEIAGERFGLPVSAVVEVMHLPDKLTRVPRAPAFVLGIVSHRGTLLPIVDQRSRFGADGAAAAARPRVVVTRLGDLQVGFVVDGAAEIASLAADRVQQTPDLTRDGARLFDRIATQESDGGMILLIDPQELLNRAEREVVAALAKDGGKARSS